MTIAERTELCGMHTVINQGSRTRVQDECLHCLVLDLASTAGPVVSHDAAAYLSALAWLTSAWQSEDRASARSALRKLTKHATSLALQEELASSDLAVALLISQATVKLIETERVTDLVI